MSRPRTTTGREAEHVIGYLALRVAGWFVLLTYRRGGPSAAVDALGQCGGAGIGDDGVWRSWSTMDTGRGKIAYREGSHDAESRVVAVREVLQWAAARFGAEDWARLEELAADRSAGVEVLFGDRDLWSRRTYRPGDLTKADRVQIAAGESRRCVAERVMRDLVATRLSSGVPVAGEQLELFEPPPPLA